MRKVRLPSAVWNNGSVKQPVVRYGLSLLGVVAVSLLIGLTGATAVPNVTMLYLLPTLFAATRWGSGPAIVAAGMAFVVHNYFFVEPVGTFTVARQDEVLALFLLLITAIVTGQLAVSAQQGAARAREAEVFRRSDELKTALLHSVSHDLRTPLAAIKAGVSNLRQTDVTLSEADRADLLADMEEETDRLTRLITNLLDLSRIESGTAVSTPDWNSLGEIVGAVVARLRPVLDGHPICLDLPESLPCVPFDSVQIAQVLTNLIENAARHTPPGTPIEISARVSGGQVRIRVADRGQGIRPEDRERIFEPFTRVGTGRRAGSGLGLAIARGLVRAHDGQIWVEEPPDGGARFVFTLPLRKQ